MELTVFSPFDILEYCHENLRVRREILVSEMYPLSEGFLKFVSVRVRKYSTSKRKTYALHQRHFTTHLQHTNNT